MASVDIIILSHAKNAELDRLTQQTITSCLKSENSDNIRFNFLVIEQQAGINYHSNPFPPKVKHISEDFNYNRFMNIGIGMTTGDYVCLCNNDLIFSPGWCSNIIDAMKLKNLLSASPFCPRAQGIRFKNGPNIDMGYSNGNHLSGWCIMCKRELFNKIGPIDEDFPFWFADNAYSEQLNKFGVKHALVRNSIVTHLGSSTLNGLPADKQDEITMGYARKFIAKYPGNESARFFKRVLESKGEKV